MKPTMFPGGAGEAWCDVPVGASFPFYFELWCPVQQAVLDAFRRTGLGAPPDVDLGVHCIARSPDANTNSMGFAWMELILGPGDNAGHGWDTQFAAMTAVGNQFPVAPNGLLAFTDFTGAYAPTHQQGITYDPTALPVGGVDYPTWTQTITDKLTLPVLGFGDRRTLGGGIWVHASLQVVCAFNGIRACGVDVIATQQ